MSTMPRNYYVSMYGPTTGDRVRLGDTKLWVEVEKDLTTFGEELKFGSGQVIRDGMGQSQGSRKACMDTIIANALIIDHWGITKADIGIKDGIIAGIGKAGNPDTQDGVTMLIGPNTDIISAEGMIITAGAVDTNAHFISPEQITNALMSGVTTMLGGGTGPSNASTIAGSTPGAWHIQKMLQATDNLPMNIGLFGKGNASAATPLTDQITAGAMGLKLHEAWGSTPSAIDTCVNTADLHDIQISLHIDTLNESGFIEEMVNVLQDRTIQTHHNLMGEQYYSPDIIQTSSFANILPASTNACAFTTPMPSRARHSNTATATKKIDTPLRNEMIAAQEIMHDLGAFSIINAHSQTLGRAGDMITRSWQTAHKMKIQRGALTEDCVQHDNIRVKRYISKYTINPAIAYGISEYVGSIETGKLADIVIWKPALFGVKPSLVLKGGMLAAGLMDNLNTPAITPQLSTTQNLFGSCHQTASVTSMTFTSKLFFDNANTTALNLQKPIKPVSGCRTLTKSAMIHNSYRPTIDLDEQYQQFRADGELITCSPLNELPLSQRYFLF